MKWYLIIPVIFSLEGTFASFGDSSPFYQKCSEKCSLQNCTKDGYFLNEAKILRSAHLTMLSWHCEDECKYECMWKTVDAFVKRKWKTPQFHGKWPFVRIFGMQEPASAIFSILNLYVHYISFKRFKREISKKNPLYKLWLFFAYVCMNAWIWSTVFHTRDLILTEFLDYACAFSMVCMTCYCMVVRLCMNFSGLFKFMLTSFCAALFLNHVYYLSLGNFDYGYNMKVNIIVGIINSIGWFGWCLKNRKRQPYLWKCASFFCLGALSMALEVLDFPPILWTFDSHALWHLSTAFITPLFYSFVIDDCKFLDDTTKKYP